MKRHDAGFTLIEVLLVVTVIGLVASIAVPSAMRARAAALELSTIATLRSIHSAENVFQATCGASYYAPSIPWLATKPTTGGTPFIGAPFTTDTTDVHGYRIRFTAGTVATAAPVTCNGLAKAKALSTFFVGADLLVATGGPVNRYFGVNQTGVIYESTKRIAPFYSGVPPAPARPIR